MTQDHRVGDYKLDTFILSQFWGPGAPNQGVHRAVPLWLWGRILCLLLSLLVSAGVLGLWPGPSHLCGVLLTRRLPLDLEPAWVTRDDLRPALNHTCTGLLQAKPC